MYGEHKLNQDLVKRSPLSVHGRRNRGGPLSTDSTETHLAIGHGATKYRLAYWCDNASVEDIVRGPWEWRDIPIWRYELHPYNLGRS